MIASAILVAVAVMLALGSTFAGELKFFIPYQLAFRQEDVLQLYVALRGSDVRESIRSNLGPGQEILPQGHGLKAAAF